MTTKPSGNARRPLRKESKIIKCPVCNEYEFEMDNNFDVCDVCGWENDGVQLDDPDYRGGANKESLNEARSAWAKQKETAAA